MPKKGEISMERIKEIEGRLKNIEREVKEIVDLIIEAREQSGENKILTKELLERYLVEISQYIKEKSKVSGESLSKGINLWKLL